MVAKSPPQSAFRVEPLLLLLLAAVTCAMPVAAQPAGPPAVTQEREFLVSATEQRLWLMSVTEVRDQPLSTVFHRGVGGTFRSDASTSGRIVLAAAVDNNLLAFFDDGAVYRYVPDQPRPLAERVLPENETPLDAIGSAGRVYAIVRSEVAAELPEYDWSKPGPTSRPFDTEQSSLSLAVYDGREWSAGVPLPPGAIPADDPRLGPRLGAGRDTLLLFTSEQDSSRVDCLTFDPQSRQWTEAGFVSAPRLAGFWAVEFGTFSTLVVATRDPAGGETVRAFRLLAGDSNDAPDWRPVQLHLSDLSTGVALAGYRLATGFNQHIALLALDTIGDAHLRFASVEGSSAETTVPLSREMSEISATEHAHNLFQMLTMFLLVSLLVGLFVFRRGSMVREIALPRGCAVALSVQRLVAWLIDFTPFTLIAAVMLDVRWSEGMSSLARWGFARSIDSGPPAVDVLLWWALSVGGYTTYMLTMELIVRRTVGKAVARVYLISENGARPQAWQILARNLMRLVELLPQFWVFILLVLLSRNHQRVGDIFARTVAIRLSPPAVADEQATESPDAADPDAPDDSGDRTDTNGDEDRPTGDQ